MRFIDCELSNTGIIISLSNTTVSFNNGKSSIKHKANDKDAKELLDIFIVPKQLHSLTVINATINTYILECCYKRNILEYGKDVDSSEYKERLKLYNNIELFITICENLDNNMYNITDEYGKGYSLSMVNFNNRRSKENFFRIKNF